MRHFLQKLKRNFYHPKPNFGKIKLKDEKELLQNVKEIELKAKSLLDLSLLGNYQTAFRGKGLEFDRVREYQDRDEERNIDWNVTARTGKFHVKSYTEERELNLFFLVDVSDSSLFSIKQKSQRQIAAEICCCLALNALKNNDRIGLALFSNSIEKFLPPRKGRNHMLSMVRHILWHPCQSKSTNIANSLEKLKPYLKKRSVLFLISDFLDNSDYKKVLRELRIKQEIVVLDLHNPVQNILPRSFLLQLQDMETGSLQTIDTYGKNFLNKVNDEKFKEDLATFLKKQQISHLTISSTEDHLKKLVKFFHYKKLGQSN